LLSNKQKHTKNIPKTNQKQTKNKPKTYPKQTKNVPKTSHFLEYLKILKLLPDSSERLSELGFFSSESKLQERSVKESETLERSRANAARRDAERALMGRAAKDNKWEEERKKFGRFPATHGMPGAHSGNNSKEDIDGALGGHFGLPGAQFGIPAQFMALQYQPPGGKIL
jgi:hypothetical protein